MVFESLTLSETDADSPWDDKVAGKIRTNFDDHEARINLMKFWPYDFKVNGQLCLLNPMHNRFKRLDGSSLLARQTLARCNVNLENPGSSGVLEIDIRKYFRPDTPITSIMRQYLANITSITQVAPALATQSISRSAVQISTQSVSLWKNALNIQSIILLGGNLARINLDATPDTDWKVNDYVKTDSAPAPGNIGTFQIVRISDDGANNIVVSNGAAVAQLTAAGTCSLMAWSYNFINPVSGEYVPGEIATFAAHTLPGNNGNFTVYALNVAGNNIIVKNSGGLDQPGVAGNANVNRWAYAFSAPASITDFIVGEMAKPGSHSNGANNGTFRITGVNQGGNNVVVYNTAGVAQGGAAGTVNTSRWVYALDTDPTTFFQVAQNAAMASSSNANNNGVFEVKQINRLSTNNIVVHNLNGVTQVGAAGTLAHTHMIVSFSSDQSAIYSTASNIEFAGVVSASNYGYHDVREVNRGGGSNYNVVVDIPLGVEQPSPAGRIKIESKSIFLTRPKIVFPSIGETAYNNKSLMVVSSDPADFSPEAAITDNDILAQKLIALDIISIPGGDPTDLTVQLA